MATSDRAILVDGVWKKFRVGEFHDSLRDLIPDLCKKMIGKGLRRQDLGDKEFWALKDVGFEVKKGESLGIIGPNGAGKSTLLKVLSRIMQPDRGRYEVTGRLSALIEVGAGFHPDLTGRENLYLNGAILGMKRQEVRAREEEIIEFAGVRPFIETPVKRYSSGMKARLGFAVAAHLQPDILLVDEVLSVGDAMFRAKCVRHMKALIQSDVTVVFISHILEQVRSLCPRTVVLDRGCSVFQGATEEAIHKYLDLLSLSGPGTQNSSGQIRPEVRNIRFLDEQGEEVLTWKAGHPAVIELDVCTPHPIRRASIKMEFMTLAGTWLGQANSNDWLKIPSSAGVFTVRFQIEPNPLGNGDFAIDFALCDGDLQEDTLWRTPQPRVITVTGGHLAGIRFDGQWSVSAEPVRSLESV